MRSHRFRLALAALVLAGCADIPQPESSQRRVTPVYGNRWSSQCLPAATPEARSCRVQLRSGPGDPARAVVLFTVMGDGRWWVASRVPITSFAAQIEGQSRIYHGHCPPEGMCFLDEADGAALTRVMLDRQRVILSFSGPFGLSGGRYSTDEFFPARARALHQHSRGLSAEAALAPHREALAPSGNPPRGDKGDGA
jgi:hypothetical protein